MTKKEDQHIGEPDSIRAIRLDDGDNQIFWFRDDLHNPYPVSAFGMSTIQRGHMWGFAAAAERVKLPPSRGAVVKTHKGRVYLGFVGITDPEEIGKRAQHFGPFIQSSMDNWEVFYGDAMKEGENLTVPNVKTDLGKLSFGELAAHLRKCQKASLRCWYLHFLTMYVADTVYMGGEQFAQNYGVEEKDYTMMLQGFETKGMASDRGQFQLAKSAMARKAVIALLESKESIEVVMEKIKESAEGREWWQEFEAYINEFGHRSTAAILDANFPTWYETPVVVVENIRNLIPRIKGGWDFEEQRTLAIKLREEAVEQFRKLLKPEEKEAFEKGLPQWQKAHSYNEDHWFYFEQMSWSGLHYAAMEAGRRLSKQEILVKPEDIFHLTYEEILEALESCEEAVEVASYAYSHLLMPLVAFRKRQHQEAEAVKGSAFVGVIPDRVEDPIAIKVFGLTDFLLDKARRELAGETVEVGNKFDGFPGSPGVVEGPARVITRHEEFPKLKVGDILVCPYTSPAWTPIFTKIKGVVTDSGGMLTHAAICAREYGIPAVVGTWVATTSVKNGDIIRIDGTNGTVEIISKV